MQKLLATGKTDLLQFVSLAHAAPVLSVSRAAEGRQGRLRVRDEGSGSQRPRRSAAERRLRVAGRRIRANKASRSSCTPGRYGPLRQARRRPTRPLPDQRQDGHGSRSRKRWRSSTKRRARAAAPPSPGSPRREPRAGKGARRCRSTRAAQPQRGESPQRVERGSLAAGAARKPTTRSTVATAARRAPAAPRASVTAKRKATKARASRNSPLPQGPQPALRNVEAGTLRERQLAAPVDACSSAGACSAFHASEPDSRPPPVSFSPPNAPPISAPDVPMLTLAMPQSLPDRREKRSRRRAHRCVKIADDNPCGTPLFCAIASSSAVERASRRGSARRSRAARRRIALRRPVTIVGSTKNPGPSPHVAAADDRAAGGASPRRARGDSCSTAAASISGPISVAAVQRVADAHLRVTRRRAERRSRRGARDATISRRVARAALACSADGAEHDRGHDEIEIGVVGHDRPRCCRRIRAATLPKRAATVVRDLAARRANEPVNDTSAMRRIRRRATAPARCRTIASAKIGGSAERRRRRDWRDACTASARERRLRRRLPHDGIAAHRGEHRVPRPHRDGKVERSDHADDAERMPLLASSGAAAARWHRLAVQHAATARRRSRAMSIISCTSPSPSALILPFSRAQRASPERILSSRSST